ncbi:MAG TPA: hypothetical protein VGR35_14455 [Tepidisphaeraceae bacterium]|nr:hypothetical protein [Tepidisphaeraceae bacterium]
MVWKLTPVGPRRRKRKQNAPLAASRIRWRKQWSSLILHRTWGIKILWRAHSSLPYHLIWTIYGYWLPNDVRGSSSKTIRKDLLKDLGELHRGRKKIQPLRHDLLKFFDNARERLEFAVREFSAAEIACIAKAFGGTINACRYTCWACAIMPDHVHLIIRKHKHTAELMLANLQRESHLALREAGLFDVQHPVWGGPGWSVFLDHPDDVWRTIEYVEKNPLEIGLPKQVYFFVKPYDNWPSRTHRCQHAQLKLIRAADPAPEDA